MHSVSLQEQKVFTATEIKEVVSFNDKEVVLLGKDDNRIVIEGGDLKINGFSKEGGNFALSGQIKAVKYAGAKESILKKLFK